MFAAPIFTAKLAQPEVAGQSLLAFAAMCLLGSATYVANDLRDVEQDRRHPRKRLRPIASGALSPGTAGALGLVCLVGGGALAVTLGSGVAWLALTYLVLQGVYNAGLRSVPVADVFVIASGFIVRPAVGAAAIGVELSGWLLFCTGSLALMLGFGKRRSEWVAQGDAKAETRTSLSSYSRESLDALIGVTASAAVLSYGLYALESPTAQRHPAILLTVPFVLYGVCHYLYRVFSSTDAAEPEVLLFRDPHLLFSILGFLVAAGLAMAGVHLPLLGVGR